MHCRIAALLPAAFLHPCWAGEAVLAISHPRAVHDLAPAPLAGFPRQNLMLGLQKEGRLVHELPGCMCLAKVHVTLG